MTARIGVVAGSPEFDVAVSGLPFRAEAVPRARDAVVVVDGGGAWWDAAQRAVEDGARAVLVADPEQAPLHAIEALAAAVDIPLLLHRPRLRHDLVDVALAARGAMPPRVIVAECRAGSDELPGLVRDAIGWTRVLAGGPLDLVPTAGGVLLRAAEAASLVGTVIATATTPRGALLRIRALGETTTELELDDPLGRRELSTSTAAGRMIAPALHESAARAALRRALDAAASGERVDDLGRLRHDASLAAGVASAHF